MRRHWFNRPWRSARWKLPLLAAGLGLSAPALAFVGFVTISEREKVGVTIYNSEDLTLVRDVRRTVMKPGRNSMRYQWSGTLIDPTSLMPFVPPGVKLADTTYPLGDGEALVWNFDAGKQVSGPLGIQYFTSGLTWKADHLATLTGDGKAKLETWIRVNNNSGEDFDHTQINLVVGEVRLVEKIRELAERFAAEGRDYGRSEATKDMMYEMADEEEESAGEDARYMMNGGSKNGVFKSARPKSVERESLSELHLYRIEGTEDIPNRGARRMRAFKYGDLSVRDVYRCSDPSGWQTATRVFSFKNTKDNNMGKQPLPEGGFQLYRGTSGGLTYEGRGQLPYTPMGEETEVPLGSNAAVYCDAKQTAFLRKNIQKDSFGRIKGHEQTRTYRVKLVNGASTKAFFELRQHIDSPWSTDLKEATREDNRTLLYKTLLGAAQSKVITFTVTTKHGVLAEGKGK